MTGDRGVRAGRAGAGHDVVGTGPLREVAGAAHEVLAQRIRADDDPDRREGGMRHVDDRKHVVEDRLVVARDERTAVEDEVDLGRALLEGLATPRRP